MKLLSKLLGISGIRPASEAGQLSHDVVQEAVEDVVDGTDPKIRLVSGYKRKLQTAVSTSLSYIDDLVEKIPGPFEVSRRTFVSDPHVNAFFATPEDMRSIFSQSQELRAFFEKTGNNAVAEGYALLCMNRQDKTVFGTALQGDMLQREVTQTTVNFSEHKVLSPAASEEGVRQGIKKCIFDGLITHALQHLLDLKTQKRDLEDQRRILHARLRARQAAGNGLSAMLNTARAPEVAEEGIVEKLAEAEQRLKQIPAGLNAPRDYLKEVSSILDHPDNFIRLKVVSILLNRMGVKVDADSAQQASQVRLAEVEISDVLKRVVAIVRYPRSEMQPVREFA